MLASLEKPPKLMPLLIDGHPIETVRSHKVLGLTIQNNLKWDEHIYEIVSKASKRLNILRVLRRSGIPPADLLTVYIALVSPILEYNTLVKFGTALSHAIYLTNLKKFKSEPCVLYTGSLIYKSNT